MGDFVIELRTDRAPLTAPNFLRYVREGFYSNTLFHRVVANFVIQGGGHDATTLNLKTDARAASSTSRATACRTSAARWGWRAARRRTRAMRSSTSTWSTTRTSTRCPPAGAMRCSAGWWPGMDVVDRIGETPTGAVGPVQVRCAAEARHHPEDRDRRRRRTASAAGAGDPGGTDAASRTPSSRPSRAAWRGCSSRTCTWTPARAAATGQFLEFLAHEARGAQALYILGDLFEAWVGDDDREPANGRVCAGAARARLERRGLLRAARQPRFPPRAGFCERSGCHLLPDPVIAQLEGERVLLTHGDALCTDDHAYQELRSIVRSPGWQRRFLALPRSCSRAAGRRGARRQPARTPRAPCPTSWMSTRRRSPQRSVRPACGA